MSRKSSATATVQDVLEHPYVKRVIDDPEIRENARAAYASAREAIDRVSGAKHPVSAIFDDSKLQGSIRDAGSAVAGARAGVVGAKRKRKRGLGSVVVVGVVGAALAVALSEGLRNKVLDLLFGAEEEFDYVPTTAPPATPAPAPAATSAPAKPEPVAASAKKSPNGSAEEAAKEKDAS